MKDTKKTAVEEDDKYQFMDVAEMEKRGYNSQQLRKYEFQKMRYYYYAVIYYYCNTKKIATKLYDEYNTTWSTNQNEQNKRCDYSFVRL